MTHRGFTGGSRDHSKGQALVEFILALPLFLVLLMGLIDFGRVIWAQSAIQMNADSAARFASVSPPHADADIRTRAQRISPAVSYDPLTAITGESGSFYPDGTADGGRVVVQIVVDVPIITPFVSQIAGGTVTIRATAEELIH